MAGTRGRRKKRRLPPCAFREKKRIAEEGEKRRDRAYLTSRYALRGPLSKDCYDRGEGGHKAPQEREKIQPCLAQRR